MRYLCYLQGAGHGRLLEMPVRDQGGCQGRKRLCGGLGRVQPQLSPVLHEPLDKAEQQVSTMPAGVDCAEVGEIVVDLYSEN